MELLAAGLDKHIETSTRYIATLEEHNRALKVQIVRLEAEIDRLHRMEEALRTMARADHAASQLLRLIDAGR